MSGDYSPIAGGRPGERTTGRSRGAPRQYFCRRCRSRVLICSHCDRGNAYCSRDCARRSRRDVVRAAGRRYQNSRRGRLCHAERQRRYRLRMKKVTHPGSPPSPTDGLLVSPPMVADEWAAGVRQSPRCHWCERRCPEHVRTDFLRRRGGMRHSDGDRRHDHSP